MQLRCKIKGKISIKIKVIQISLSVANGYSGEILRAQTLAPQAHISWIAVETLSGLTDKIISLLVCLLAFLPACFLACLLSCLLSFLPAGFLACLLSCLLAFLPACFLACLLSCLLAFLPACFLACLLSCLLSFLLACKVYQSSKLTSFIEPQSTSCSKHYVLICLSLDYL